ncbi:uncharacterized protein LOC112659658 [Canis lupus dingo]|uniref:uncharacterized protein LOC112659658 n=1 Tax=Canis lupus dingo TaxID=286419 RepID=UPI0020C501EE|nr:uncharacterized protein LOC112659658 [Canis lupus dingo]
MPGPGSAQRWAAAAGRWGCRLLALLLLLLLPGPGGASEITFELPDNAKQCFYEDITQGTKCTLEFQVITGGHYDVDCRLEDPDGNVLYKEMKKQYDSFTFTASKNGTYKFCFSNEFSTFTHKTVYFDFQVGEDPPLFPSENRVSALTQMESACVSIHEALKSVIDYQTHFRLREAQGRSRAEDLNTRVAYWSVGEALILLVVSIGQVFLLKSFFSDKRTTTTRVGSAQQQQQQRRERASASVTVPLRHCRSSAPSGPPSLLRGGLGGFLGPAAARPAQRLTAEVCARRGVGVGTWWAGPELRAGALLPAARGRWAWARGGRGLSSGPGPSSRRPAGGRGPPPGGPRAVGVGTWWAGPELRAGALLPAARGRWAWAREGRGCGARHSLGEGAAREVSRGERKTREPRGWARAWARASAVQAKKVDENSVISFRSAQVSRKKERSPFLTGRFTMGVRKSKIDPRPLSVSWGQSPSVEVRQSRPESDSKRPEDLSLRALPESGPTTLRPVGQCEAAMGLGETTPGEEEEEEEEVFLKFVILHAEDDTDEALRVQSLLQNDFGIRPGIIFAEMPCGRQHLQNLDDAVNGSAWTILLLTENFLRDTWCKFQFYTSLMNSVNRRHKYNSVIPMRPLNKPLPRERTPFALRTINALEEDSRGFPTQVERIFQESVYKIQQSVWREARSSVQRHFVS